MRICSNNHRNLRKDRASKLTTFHAILIVCTHAAAVCPFLQKHRRHSSKLLGMLLSFPLLKGSALSFKPAKGLQTAQLAVGWRGRLCRATAGCHCTCAKVHCAVGDTIVLGLPMGTPALLRLCDSCSYDCRFTWRWRFLASSFECWCVVFDRLFPSPARFQPCTYTFDAWHWSMISPPKSVVFSFRTVWQLWKLIKQLSQFFFTQVQTPVTLCCGKLWSIVVVRLAYCKRRNFRTRKNFVLLRLPTFVR